MENTILINKIKILPNSLKEEVNDFIDFLLSKRNKKSANNIDVFSGIWSKEESKEIEDIIKNGAENIDNEW
jgi:predicted CopG family antitoxin